MMTFKDRIFIFFFSHTNFVFSSFSVMKYNVYCTSRTVSGNTSYNIPLFQLHEPIFDISRCLRNIYIQKRSIYVLFSGFSLANVAATINGRTKLTSAYTLTDLASALIFPQLIASSGLAPASDPSNSCPVFM